MISFDFGATKEICNFETVNLLVQTQQFNPFRFLTCMYNPKQTSVIRISLQIQIIAQKKEEQRA